MVTLNPKGKVSFYIAVAPADKERAKKIASNDCIKKAIE
jgi:hypothetical protein